MSNTLAWGCFKSKLKGKAYQFIILKKEKKKDINLQLLNPAILSSDDVKLIALLCFRGLKLFAINFNVCKVSASDKCIKI